MKPGELFFGSGSVRVRTLLGSCVAITVWHPSLRIGGMCHYLLPERSPHQPNDQRPYGYYATDAVQYFVDNAYNAGIPPDRFEVKLFGGANMFDNPVSQYKAVNVARDNIERGLQLLSLRGFRVKTSDVGGHRYRNVYLDLLHGDVWVKQGGRGPSSPRPDVSPEPSIDP